jgi:hypothetical protein
VLSIVTVAKCPPHELAETVVSVETHCHEPYEHILIINRIMAQSRLPPETSRRRIFICDDSGIYDAMNRGVAASRGTHLWFLNAGDTATDESSELVRMALLNEAAITYGYTINVDALGRHVGRWPGENCDGNLLSGPVIAHQAAIMHRAVFARVGLYDTRYRINGDYDHFVRCALARVPCRSVPIAGALYKLGGISGTAKALKRREYIDILCRNGLMTLRERLRCLLAFPSDTLFQRVHAAIISGQPVLQLSNPNTRPG